MVLRGCYTANTIFFESQQCQSTDSQFLYFLAISASVAGCIADAAWRDWHDVAGLPFTPKKNALSLPDANIRLKSDTAIQLLLYNNIRLRGQDLNLRPSGHEPNIFGGFLPTNRGGG